MPATALRNAVAYEEWLAEVDGDFAWKSFDENTAAGMCYTSGTTGNPKGVLYSHRSNVLHSPWRRSVTDMIGLSSRDTVMPVVPMFHANCWGLPFPRRWPAPAMVMPGQSSTAHRSTRCSTSSRCPARAAVPTVWLALLQHLETSGGELPHLRRVVIGGSACPRAMITQKFQDVTASRSAMPGA
jgi:fatty-acyl-CoA synthase